ncbi:hypothetical protein, partial [Armatimonas sp.]|uniref:hypothetical protein n=1 Tax=Armatimonas sp. TaxID=1872638 RepID=UPI00286D25A8
SSINVTIPAVAQLTFNKTSFTLAAGASTTVNVGFDCSEVPPFSRTITLTTTVGATTVTRTVAVQLQTTS